MSVWHCDWDKHWDNPKHLAKIDACRRAAAGLTRFHVRRADFLLVARGRRRRRRRLTIHVGPTVAPLQKPNLVHFALGIFATQMAIVLDHL